MTQIKFIFILFLMGIILGPLFDGFHTYSGTTAYTNPLFLRMAWWVPLLFGVAYLTIGVTHLDFYKFFKLKKQFLGWSQVIIGFLFFALLYFASGFLEIGSPLKTVLLISSAILIWLLFSGTWQGLTLAIFTGLAGSLIEILLIHYKTFFYLQPDLWGIPAWLPAIYMAGSVVGGNLVRKLWNL